LWYINNMDRHRRIPALRIVFSAVLAVSLLFPVISYGLGENVELKVYIIRHAETMGNATGNYCEHNQRTFSPKGLKQIDNMAEKLKDFHFDHIFVSPAYRTQRTILPYLKAHNITAEIWPELEEQCFDITSSTQPAGTIPKGEKIEIVDKKYLKLRDASNPYRYRPHNASEALAQFMKARDMIMGYYGTGKSVLLVCHYCTGNRLMEILLGLEPKGDFGPENCAVSLLEGTGNGAFKMTLNNDRPFTHQLH